VDQHKEQLGNQINPIFNVDGRIALVTGASGGFGAHFAKLLALHGARVVLAARRQDKLDSLVKEIVANGGEAVGIALDVTDKDSIKSVFDAAESVYGVVDIVSNNAGVAESKMALNTEKTSWDNVINTNLNGVWMIALEAATRLVAANKSGSIVNTASILGVRVALSQSSYATSKAGVIQLTKSLALEWSRKNIRVNALCPGYFVTDMNRDYMNSEKGQAYMANTPAQRTGRLEELNAPFLLLASDAGSFVNGTTLTVDGAHSIANM